MSAACRSSAISGVHRVVAVRTCQVLHMKGSAHPPNSYAGNCWLLHLCVPHVDLATSPNATSPHGPGPLLGSSSQTPNSASTGTPEAPGLCFLGDPSTCLCSLPTCLTASRERLAPNACTGECPCPLVTGPVGSWDSFVAPLTTPDRPRELSIECLAEPEMSCAAGSDTPPWRSRREAPALSSTPPHRAAGLHTSQRCLDLPSLAWDASATREQGM